MTLRFTTSDQQAVCEKIFREWRPILIVILAVLCSWAYVAITNPPTAFPTGAIVTVYPGTSLTSIGQNLKAEHVITSTLLFRSAAILLGGEKKIIAGDYLLDKREPVFVIAWRMVRGSFHLEPIKITIPEGWNIFQISDALGKHFPHFDTTKFLSEAKSDEGYLFPDTYFISPVATPETVIHTMRDNFDSETAGLQATMTEFSKPEKDIITMASIVEAEARTTADRQIVAGILWNRLALGMPLQVDSTFMYINGKNTYQLTSADLKIDSPYNTYINTGLPPTPIDNPGLDSIQATITPTVSDYLYFFSAKDGTMHYAKTYAEHQKNISLYGK